MSFCVESGKAAYLPLAHRYAGAPDQLDLDATLALLKPWLESERHAKLGHHLKYDAHVLRNHGIRLPASRTTPCSRPTSSSRTRATTWIRSLRAISASRPSSTTR
jgi:hypothetical protein